MSLLYESMPVARSYTRWRCDTLRESLRTLLGPQVLRLRRLLTLAEEVSLSSDSESTFDPHVMFDERFIERALTWEGYALQHIDVAYWSETQFVTFLLAGGFARYVVKVRSPTPRPYARYWARARARQGEAALRRKEDIECVWIAVACDVRKIFACLVDDADAPGSSGVEPLNSANLWRLITCGVVDFALLYKA